MRCEGAAEQKLRAQKEKEIRDRADKSCNFLCGSKLSDKDPCDPDRQSMRWAYDPAEGPPTGEGANDWYCERLWSQFSGVETSLGRLDFQKEIAKDIELNKKWRSARAEYINKRIRSKKDKSLPSKEHKRRAGLKRVSVKSSRFNECALVKPEDWFWPMGRYRKKHGSPDLPKNKKLGHIKKLG